MAVGGARSLLAAVSLVLLTITPAPAGAHFDLGADRPCVGVQFHGMWGDYNDAQRAAVLDKLDAAGVGWVRIDFGWSSLQPSGRNSYAAWYLERADAVVNAARARGLDVLMSLGRTPAWANGGEGPNVPPSDPSDYGQVARFLASYFAARVSAWGVYNEPNHSGGDFWTGTAADYAELLRASYPLFKAGDPHAKVVAGHVVYNDDVWLRQMYEAGAQGSFDVLATHPYQGVSDEPPGAPDNGTKWRMMHAPAVHELMCEFGDCHKEIWFTEFGWSSHPNRPGYPNWQRGVTREQQASFLIKTLEIVREKLPFVTNVFWYRERNGDTGNPQLDNYGLLERDLRPKPAYRTLAAYMARLGREGPLARCRLGLVL